MSGLTVGNLLQCSRIADPHIAALIEINHAIGLELAKRAADRFDRQAEEVADIRATHGKNEFGGVVTVPLIALGQRQ